MKNILSNVKGDLFGGLTAGIVALPLALAFGEQTELGAIAGLYGAIAIGIFAAIFGGTPTQISGPTAPMTVVSAVIIADSIKYAGSFEAGLPIVIATFVLAGFFQVMLGLFKLGSYIKYVPYPVVSGFMSGIGVIIVISQIFPFFGVNSPDGGVMATINSIHKIPEIVNVFSIIIALSTIVIIYLLPKLTKKIPSTLVALFVVSILAYFLIPEGQILKLNSSASIPSGLPKIYTNFFSVFLDAKHFLIVIEYAATLAALGAIDSLLTSLVADNMTKTKHRSNQELVGQGLGNIVAGFIGGLPGAGATMRTVININSGGKTKLSGVVAGMLLLTVLLGLGKLVGHIPNAVLAGILITVGIGIIDYKGFRYMKVMPRSETLIMLSVLFLTVTVDLLFAVAFGMVFAAILFMKNISDFVESKTYSESLQSFSREIPWLDEGDIEDSIGDKIYIKHLEGPMFFGSSSRFKDMINALPEIETVIFRVDRVPYIDQSGLISLESACLDFENRGINVAFIGLQGQPKDLLHKVKIIPNLVPENMVFDKFKDCLAWLESKYDGILHKNLTA